MTKKNDHDLQEAICNDQHEDRQDEEAVQATNNSSFMSKSSMVQLGYVPCHSISNYELFLNGQKVKRRAPLINRFVGRS